MKPIDKALEMVKTGSSIVGAVRATGCSWSVLMRVMEHEGLLVEVEGFKQRKTLFDANRYATALRLIKQGRTIQRAAAESGICESLIYRWCRKIGIENETNEMRKRQLDEWREKNPWGKKTKAARELGWGISKVYRYWK